MAHGRMAFLAPRDLLVFVAFNSLCCDWNHGDATVTNEFLAEQSGVDIRRIKGRGGALSRLVDAGLLKRVGGTTGRALIAFAMPDDPKAEVKNLRAMWNPPRPRVVAGNPRGVSKWRTLGVKMADTRCQFGGY